MLCQECKSKKATVHLTKIINNNKTEVHLCQQCASEKGELEFAFEPKFSIHHFFSGLLDVEGFEAPVGVPAPAAKIQCDNCGLTYTQFSQIGRLGCNKCYSFFRERLNSLLRRIHGSTHHTGKVPHRSGSRIRVKKEIEEMRAELQQKIAQEEFEEAAKIRDKIKGLEREVKGGGEKNE
ncbi:MAG: hypothetical protein D5R97_00975 [Candidatus Syntrophonatronum acetioxidans]|uniref:UVR domain-containing protein n=1 Tax=Candidatus Syntrophonatronum acetioxidans TaxID=1795816 RepID=A0A424YIA4_9FIRM|nr:MAG: hypothetical protein D5R97_00975 [Candidatus Syntrophonatronum acetioxidans]